MTSKLVRVLGMSSGSDTASRHSLAARKKILEALLKACRRQQRKITRHSPLATRHFLPLLLLVLFVQLTSNNLQLPLSAQTTNATLTGQVTDTSGAAVPNAKVVAVNDATNVHYETKTNNDGIYIEPNLPPGTYHMEITKEGFKTVMQPGIELHVQDGRSANYVLQVGAMSETVTVHGSGININTTDGNVSTTVDRQFAENLPLNGRSFQTLLLLTPGTSLTPVAAGSNGGQISVNGQRANSNSWDIDGVSSVPSVGLTSNALVGPGFNGANPALTVAGTTQNLISVDALQEFKIQTSSYSPEFGRQPGGQISLLSRSGTNEFHGTVFDYLRNDIFDANNWFNDARINPTTGKSFPKGKERQNDFGATLGAPIVKNKTFVFLSYEGLRLLQPFTSVLTVPSLRIRQEAGASLQPILNSFPLPQGAEILTSSGVPTGAAPYVQTLSNPTRIDSGSLRVDQTIGSRLHLFGRYAHTASDAENISLNQSFGLISRTQSATVGIDAQISPVVTNELRLSYGVANASLPITTYLQGGGKAFDPSIFFPAPLVRGQDFVQFYVNLDHANFNFADGGQERNSQRLITVVNNTSYSHGVHQLKGGIDYRRLLPVFRQDPLQVNYNINSETDLASDNVSQVFSASVQVAHPIYTNFSAYVQDTWRATNRLTLTYGLRWELNPTPGERDGIIPYNIIGLANPATATLAPLNSRLYDTTYNNFAPRVGIAYRLGGSARRETVLRAGWGIFYDLDSEAAANGYRNAPFFNYTTLANVSFPVASGVIPVAPLPTPTTPPFTSITAIDPHLELPYTMQWNVSAEQGLGENQTLSVSYVASAGDRLLRADHLFNLSPNVSNITAIRNASSSNYQSLQVQYNRRLSMGLQALASYTYAHSIDNASNAEDYFASLTSGGNTFPDPNVDRGNSDFDLRHVLRGAVTYNIPSWRANFISRAIFGGWSVDMIGLAQTGTPVDLIGRRYFPAGGPPNGVRLRPNIVPGQPFYVYGAACQAINIVNKVPTPCPGGMGINPNAFTSVAIANGKPVLNPGYSNGTLGRNVLRNLGASQMDLGLHRQFDLSERVKIRFIAESFNIFNHPNFGPFGNNLRCGNGCFGMATSTLNNNYGALGLSSLYQIGGPRSIQFALKAVF